MWALEVSGVQTIIAGLSSASGSQDPRVAGRRMVAHKVIPKCSHNRRSKVLWISMKPVFFFEQAATYDPKSPAGLVFGLVLRGF